MDELVGVLGSTRSSHSEGMRYQEEDQGGFEVHPSGGLSVSHASVASCFFKLITIRRSPAARRKAFWVLLTPGTPCRVEM